MWIGDLQWQGALGDGTVLLLAELGVWRSYCNVGASECYYIWLILLFKKEIASKLVDALGIGNSWVQSKNLLKQ